MTQLSSVTQELAPILKEREQTVCVAESSTGGLIAASLLAVPGASAYFIGGSVIYTARSRKILLQVKREDLEGLEPLTEAMAAAFAKTAREQLKTTWAISELGIAGPTPARYGNPPGISVIAIDGPVCKTRVVETGSNDREANMWQFTKASLELLREALVAQAN
ncbi:MAG: CinA family protein [Burkholderiaceae bacterium]